MKTTTPLLLAFLAGSVLTLTSQELKQATSSPEGEPFSYFLSDVSYVSDAVFMGRRDTVAAPYLLPSLGYYHKSGFYADASLSYLLAEGEGRVDLILASAGYQASGERWSGGAAVTAYFFDEASYNVQSETVAGLTGLLGYDWKVVETQVSLHGFFGPDEGADFFLGLTLMKDLKDPQQHWLFRPQVSLYAGSQYFYQAYYNTSRLGNRKDSGRGQGSSMEPVSELLIDEVAAFKVLNVEFGLPVHFFQKHWIITASPYLSLPQSPATVSGAEMDYEEDLKPVFYISAGISYWW